jgi:hypothetical protein
MPTDKMTLKMFNVMTMPGNNTAQLDATKQNVDECHSNECLGT